MSVPYERLLSQALPNYTSLARPDVAEVSPARDTSAATAGTTAEQALKVGVDVDGLYRLTYTDLHNAGFDLEGVDPRTFKLHNRGSEVAIAVVGQDDGVFDAADYVLFYGTALHDPYTTRNIYWLSAQGDYGRRMAARSGAAVSVSTAVEMAGMAKANYPLYLPLVGARQYPPGAPVIVPTSFPTLLRAEQDTADWQTMPGSGEDRWFWDKRLSPDSQGIPTSRAYPLLLHNVPKTTTAALRVRLKGYTSLAHRTRISLNGHLVADDTWSGQIQYTQQAQLPQVLLREGENRVVVEAVDTGAVVDQLLVNWFELDDRDSYVAENDQLLFGAPAAGRYRFEIGGFTQTDNAVFDVTDPTNPVQITGITAVGKQTPYQVAFEDVAWSTSRYLALSTTQFKVPPSILLDQNSAWKSPDHSADYIIITHADFYASAQVLAEHRRARG